MRSQYLPPLVQEKKLRVKDMMLQYMQKMEQIAQSQQASIQSLERQVGQLAKALIEREPSNHPYTTEVNSKETTMAVTLSLCKYWIILSLSPRLN